MRLTDRNRFFANSCKYSILYIVVFFPVIVHGACVTFRDEFSNTSLGNNDGSLNFADDWDLYDGSSATTPSQTPNLASGHVRITNGKLMLNNYSPESQNFPGVERRLNLSSFNSANFSFEFETSGNVDLVDSIVIMASPDGGTNWTILEDIRGIKDTSGSKNYDLTPFISNNTKIRMRINNEAVSGLGSGCCYGASPETFSVDKVQIEACGTGSNGGGDTVANTFNCVENGLDGVSGKLFTKTTAQSFSFDLIALKDANTIETNFASGTDHNVTLELVDSSSGGSCAGFNPLSPVVSQNVTFTASDAGIKTSNMMNSTQSYRSVKCRITDNTDSTPVVGCSTDSFAIRPTSFTVASNMTNSTTAGSLTAVAGDNVVTLTATTDTGYNGTPKIDSSKIQAHINAVTTGTLNATFSAASVGVASANNASYSEVGSFRIATEGVYDDTFTAVDTSSECTNDFSNTVNAGKVGCKFGNTANSNYFGRFTPAYFDITLNTPAFSASCGSFSYLGQPVKYAAIPVATVTAKNKLGNTTQNYSADFWKINPLTITPSYSISGHSLSVLESGSPTAIDNGNGSGSLSFADTSTNILSISKNALTAPFNAEIAMSFSLTDSDSIAVGYVNGSAQSNPVSFGTTTTGNGISFNGNKEQRWGRLAMNNAHGSELNPLSIPVYTEYYNGFSFTTNTSDSCTSLSLSNDFSISDNSNYSCVFSSQNSPVAIGSGSVKATLTNTLLSAGVSSLLISDNSNTSLGPGLNNTGTIDVTSKLANLSWLLYDWDGDTNHDNCPSARASFGIYKGNDKQIYFREVY